jgi:hypothetical protein
MSVPRVRIVVTPLANSEGWTVAAGDLPSHEIRAHSIGDVRVPVTDRTDLEDLDSLLKQVAMREPRHGDAKRYGQWLFDCLLLPVWQEIRAIPAVEAAGGVELALNWPNSEADLHPLVWEAMHDGISPLAGLTDLLVAITRLVPSDAKEPPQIAQPRLLLAIGSPADDEVVSPGVILMGLTRSLEMAGLCATWFESNVTIGELGQLCKTFQPNIIHLVAHGDVDEKGRSVLKLRGDGDQNEPVNADRLVTAMTGHGDLVMAVISACRTGSGSAHEDTVPLAIDLVAGRIPIVVAMTGEVSEQSCRLYAKKMIEAVQNGQPIVEAAAQGRRAALTANPEPGDHLDWAMPALFMAESVRPEFELVDPRPARLVWDVAEKLGLRRNPVFIGRRAVLQAADNLLPEDENAKDKLGFVVAMCTGPMTDLGGTRLLREMGYRLLKQGHIPLFLGPYRSGFAPCDLRSFVVDLLTRALTFAEELELPPPLFTVIGAGTAQLVEGIDYTRCWELLGEFKTGGGDLDPKTVRSQLRNDLNAMADAASKMDPPFGSHTRPVLLGDQAHTWLSMLDILIEITDAYGLGTRKERIPVVLTSSITEDRGAAMEQHYITNRGQPGYLFRDLKPLPIDEAVLGFQWVLLNPWLDPEDPVYAPARGADREPIVEFFRELHGLPAAVAGRLYQTAASLVRAKLFVEANDSRQYETQSKAWR